MNIDYVDACFALNCLDCIEKKYWRVRCLMCDGQMTRHLINEVKNRTKVRVPLFFRFKMVQKKIT